MYSYEEGVIMKKTNLFGKNFVCVQADTQNSEAVELEKYITNRTS